MDLRHISPQVGRKSITERPTPFRTQLQLLVIYWHSLGVLGFRLYKWYRRTFRYTFNCYLYYYFKLVMSSTPKRTGYLYKTSLCIAFRDTKLCPLGDRCPDAHGFSELRLRNWPPVQPVTEECPYQKHRGYCRKSKCPFIHKNGSQLAESRSFDKAPGGSIRGLPIRRSRTDSGIADISSSSIDSDSSSQKVYYCPLFGLRYFD